MVVVICITSVMFVIQQLKRLAMGEHDSAVVLRLPVDLKNTLQEEAALMDISLSELIRLKLQAIDRNAHEETMLRVKGQQFRLEELFLPEVISHGYTKQGLHSQVAKK